MKGRDAAARGAPINAAFSLEHRQASGKAKKTRRRLGILVAFRSAIIFVALRAREMRGRPTGYAAMSSILRKGQRLRPVHPALAKREWGVSDDAVGTVICAYRVSLGPPAALDRVDVRFGAGLTVWGAPAAEFAPIAEGKSSGADLY